MQGEPVPMDGLPEGWTARRPDPDADVGRLREVCVADDLSVLDNAEVSAAEVLELLSLPGAPLATDQWMVVSSQGRADAWGYVDVEYDGTIQSLDGYARPDVPAAVAGALLDALVARAVQRAGDGPADLRFGVLVGHPAWEPLLRDRGFAVRRRFSRMRVDLGRSSRIPAPPPGIHVRTFDADDEADWQLFHRVLQASFREHYGHVDASYEQFRTEVAAQEHRFDRWWFAEDATSRDAVGICQGTTQYLELRGGWIRYLGVLPDARGRGIARALLRTAMASFAEDGLEWCGLGVDTSNATGALHLYESVGMRPVYQVDVWSRSSDPDGASG